MHDQQNFKQTMYVERDSVAGSRYHCCNGKANNTFFVY
jgi:hypothetical protein